MRFRPILRALTAAGLAVALGLVLQPGDSSSSAPGWAPRGGTPGAPAAAPRASTAGRAARADGTVVVPAPDRIAADGPGATAVQPDGAPRPAVGRQVVFGGPGGPPSEPRPGDPAAFARHLLAEYRGTLGLDGVPGELRIVSERTDFMGHHLRLRQFVGGVPVDGSEVAAHVGVDSRGFVRPLLLVADTFAVRGATPVPVVPAYEAVAALRALVEDGTDPPEHAESAFEHKEPRLVVLPEGRDGRLAWRIDARTGDESVRGWVDASEPVGAEGPDVLRLHDLRCFAEVAGRARVFRPNPVHSARNPSFTDRKDATSPAIEMQMQTIDLLRLDGSGWVRGRWADAARGRGAAANASFDWTALTRDDDGFEMVNAYFHVDRTQDVFQSLGITAANASAQRIHAHYLTQDQSFYDIYSDELRFGDGGVDDGEDGDVVVHEYGHAVQDDMVDDFGGTAEGQAIGEGFSDFLACALHADPAAPDPEWDVLVATWDATSYSSAWPPFLRRVDKTKTYPGDVVDEPHSDGEIWSRFLWDLRALVGPDDGLRVAVGSHAYMNANTRFKEAANAVLVANLYLREGRDDAEIRDLLRARGLPFNQPPFDAPPEDVYDTAGLGNDTRFEASSLTVGTYTDLLLADDDWYRVTVLPWRRARVQADFDAADIDLDLDLVLPDGTAVTRSSSGSGQEAVEVTAGEASQEFLVRAYRGGGSTYIDGYSLTVLDLDPEALVPGRTDPRATVPGVTDVVMFSVGPEKVAAGSRFIVTSARRKRGARNDVRVTSPSGVTLADFGSGRTAAGARVVIPSLESGAWRIEVRSRDGTAGAFALQAKFRRKRR